ncbi:MAG: F0F1 ATP synthase subunit gamma [Pseudomonadota bacterium]
MPSLKDLKKRIESVKSTRKITSAMKMVAAAKLRRAQDSAEAARPFAERMEDVVGNLAASAKDSPTAPMLLKGTGKDEVHLLVVATAERGLCGGFNSSIVKLAREHIRRLEEQRKTVKILTVGKKGREQLLREHRSKMVEHVDLSDVKRLSYADAGPIGEKVLSMYAAGEFDVATLFFNRFKSVISQIPTALQLAPVDTSNAAAPAPTDGASASYIYEPEEEEILADLLPKSVTVQVFRALLENAASEQGARMAAMDNATRNAGEMIKKLTLQYNRSRQAAITKELIEIISGAEAL